LAQGHGAICTPDAEAIANALTSLDSAQKQSKLGQVAQSVLHQGTDLDGLMRDINAALDA
jgi:hypothetical protein